MQGSCPSSNQYVRWFDYFATKNDYTPEHSRTLAIPLQNSKCTPPLLIKRTKRIRLRIHKDIVTMTRAIPMMATVSIQWTRFAPALAVLLRGRTYQPCGNCWPSRNPHDQLGIRQYQGVLERSRALSANSHQVFIRRDQRSWDTYIDKTITPSASSIHSGCFIASTDAILKKNSLTRSDSVTKIQYRAY